MYAAVRVHLDADTTIDVTPPYLSNSHHGDPMQIPWVVRIDRYRTTSLEVAADTAELTRLRDAISDALNAYQAGEQGGR